VTTRLLAYLFAIFSIATVAALYEIVEWLYAVAEGGDAGAAFLGSQGDVWDAQKDMLADTLGAVFAVALHALARRRPPRASPQHAADTAAPITPREPRTGVRRRGGDR
jgi:putative membrane protein